MSRLTTSRIFSSKLLHNSKMPTFTLYGSRGSTNTDRVRLTLAEGGFTDYNVVFLNLQKGEQKVGDLFLSEDDATCYCASKLYIVSRLQISFSLFQIFISRELTPLHPVHRTHETSPVG